MNLKKLIKIGLLLLVFSSLTQTALSQDVKNATDKIDVSGSATITNNGIAVIPSFSLGKPAAIFDLLVGKRLRFEPEFKFSLAGKPWAFLFRLRYDLLQTNKFYVRLGLNHGVSFKNRSESTNGINYNMIEAGRIFGGELKADYYLTNHLSFGLFYLQGHGFDRNYPANTSFIAFNSDVANITLFDDFNLEFKPEVYYLNVDGNDGFYAASELDLSKKDIPLTVESVINKIIHTNIRSSKNILWNISLKYSFDF